MKKVLIVSSAALLFAAVCALNVNLGTKSISAKTSGIMLNKALADDNELPPMRVPSGPRPPDRVPINPTPIPIDPGPMPPPTLPPPSFPK
jgi:hypothetical protein